MPRQRRTSALGCRGRSPLAHQNRAGTDGGVGPQSAEATDDDDDLTVPYIDKSERRPKKKQMTPREYDAWVAANASAATSRRRGGRPPARDAPRRLFTDLVDVGKSYVDLEDPEQQQRAAKRARRG